MTHRYEKYRQSRNTQEKWVTEKMPCEIYAPLCSNGIEQISRLYIPSSNMNNITLNVSSTYTEKSK